MSGPAAAVIPIGVGVAVFVLAQRAWMVRRRRSAAVEAARAAREAAAAGTLADPAKLEPATLLAALAVDEATLVASTDRGWAIADASQRSAMWMTLLIVAIMVPAIALQDVRAIAFGAIPIVLYAVVLAAQVIRPGGTLDQAYAVSDLQLAPLSLHGEERPDVVVVPRLANDTMQAKLVGATVLRGTRHGRVVEVTLDGGHSETRVAGRFDPVELEGHRQRVRPADGAAPPAALDGLLRDLGASPCWTGMRLVAGPEGVVVTRRRGSGTEQRWLYDLWLAERVASALGG